MSENTTSAAGEHRGVGGWLARHTTAVIGIFLAITTALGVAVLTMAPDNMASQEPPGEVFDARDTIDDRFGGDTEEWAFILEATDGNVLDRDGLLEVTERVEQLRQHPQLGSTLVERTDQVTGDSVHGAASFADTVDTELRRSGLGGLRGADEDTVAAAVDGLVDEHGASTLNLSQHAERRDGHWTAPALVLSVVADAADLERADDGSGLGSDVAVEERGREIDDVLDTGGALEVHGLAIDQNLTAQEQGNAAGPFIGFTVLAIVLLVGIAYRSYWVLVVVGGALVSLLVWLIGLSYLVGLKEDQILSTVVPIAMIAFGVDYAFHAVGRYREVRATGEPTRPALAGGVRAVAPALVLALLTGVVAFLANTASPIESITQFGVAAAMALTSAFIVLGFVTPATVAVIDERVPARRSGRGGRALAILGGLAAAGLAMAAVLFLVFLGPAVGLAMLAGYLVLFVAGPAWLAGRRSAQEPAPEVGTAGPGRVADRAGRGAVAVATRRRIVVPVMLALSVGAALSAANVSASFDVEDFFAADTGFVTGLDKLDEHVGDQGGEPATVLVNADVDEPAVRTALEEFADGIERSDSPALGRAANGSVEIDRTALDVVGGDTELAAAQQAQVVAEPDAAGRTAVQLHVGIVGSRAQENIAAARDDLEPHVQRLNAQLAHVDPGAEATLTGDPIVRQASLEAVARSLQLSLPIAVVACLLVSWAFLRSLRYAVVAIVPTLLVVAWLYGFMNLFGFSVNIVTATIGAISIGIGIDFATHMTMRYRQELAQASSRLAAVRSAASGTGVALTGSALTSVAGFAILALAPMPMFASFGLLTAVMIVLALLSSLLVLPGLLLLVSREPRAKAVGTDEPPAAPAASTGPTADAR